MLYLFCSATKPITIKLSGLKQQILESLLRFSWLRIQHCCSYGIGCSCSAHSIPLPGTSICCGCSRKKIANTYFSTFLQWECRCSLAGYLWPRGFRERHSSCGLGQQSSQELMQAEGLALRLPPGDFGSFHFFMVRQTHALCSLPWYKGFFCKAVHITDFGSTQSDWMRR